MTPPAKAKAPLRNTSAVPRTRKISFEPKNDAPSESALPIAAEPSTPIHIPAQIAMTTPKGPATLRKTLLLKSARKTWHETRSPQSPVENAIEDGSIQVRRKSRGSPGHSPKTAPPVVSSSDDESEADANDDNESPIEQSLVAVSRHWLKLHLAIITNADSSLPVPRSGLATSLWVMSRRRISQNRSPLPPLRRTMLKKTHSRKKKKRKRTRARMPLKLKSLLLFQIPQ